MAKVTDGSDDQKFEDAVLSILNKLQLSEFESKAYPKTSIYKVPSKLSKKNINSPHFVSIGPLHRGQADLLAMEDVKYWYSMLFFYRSDIPPNMMVLDCCKLIINIHDEVQGYYTHGLKKFDKYELMKLMVIDGCFLLELFLRNSKELKYGYLENGEIDRYGDIKETSNDLILGNSRTRSAVCQDLALFENQIPFTVLEKLMETVRRYLIKGGNIGVKDYILNFFSSSLNFTSDATPICIDAMPIRINDGEEEEEKPSHILQMLHICLLPSWTLENGMKKYGLNYGATELIESGINIKKKKFNWSDETDSFNTNLLEIKFDNKKGTLKIPLLWIGGTTSSILKNLVVFEQLNFYSSQQHVTAYVIFMKSLIRSKQDVQLLRRRGIIKQYAGSDSDRDVTDFFNTCCKGFAVVKDRYFHQVCKDVEDYSESKWIHFHSYVTSCEGRSRKYAGVLTEQICPDPCRTIAFIAATVLLILTCLQTYYSVYPYWKK